MNSSINKRVSAIVFGALTAVALVGRRSMAHWKMLAYVLVGVVLACTILAGMVVYFDALRELALKNSLAHRSSTDLDINMHTISPIILLLKIILEMINFFTHLPSKG